MAACLPYTCIGGTDRRLDSYGTPKGAHSVQCQVLDTLSSIRQSANRYATVCGDMLYIGREAGAMNGAGWALDDAFISVDEDVVSILTTCKTTTLLRMKTRQEAECWADILQVAADENRKLQRLADQRIKENGRQRKEYLERVMGKSALREALRKIRKGAMVSVQNGVVTITGLPEPVQVLRFESDFAAEDYAAQLGHIVDCPLTETEVRSRSKASTFVPDFATKDTDYHLGA